MVNVIYHNIEQISKQSGIDKVVLSGGVFQNAYLLSKLENKLKGKNYNVYSQSTIPTSDGGIALGQLVIAAKRRKWQSGKVAKWQSEKNKK
jgi:hydrogenase maturation protein HypF